MKSAPLLSLLLAITIPTLSSTAFAQGQTPNYAQSEDGHNAEVLIGGAVGQEHVMLVGYISIEAPPSPQGALVAAAVGDAMQPVTQSINTYASALASVVGAATEGQLFLSGTASQFSVPAYVVHDVLDDFVTYSLPETGIQASLDWMTEEVPSTGSYDWQGTEPQETYANPPSLVVPWYDLRVSQQTPGVFKNDLVVRHLVANQLTLKSTSGMTYMEDDEEVSYVMQAMRSGVVQGTINVQAIAFTGEYVGDRPKVRISITHAPPLNLPEDPSQKFVFRFRQGPGGVYDYAGAENAYIHVEAEEAFSASQVGNITMVIPAGVGIEPMYVSAAITAGDPWMGFYVPEGAADGPLAAIDSSGNQAAVVYLKTYDPTSPNTYVDLTMYGNQ